jgi:dTDP-4-amino-4,6-dideoxygalactose transaminase
MEAPVPIPLLDLKAQYAEIRGEILAAVTDVLDSQIYIGGPKVAELEVAIASLSACAYGVGVSSGTDALLCSLMALDLKPGDEVITSPFTFFATAACIARLNARPIFVDIDPGTYNVDPTAIEQAITSRTKGIISVHLFGQMADMDPIMDIAERHGLFVLEDAAQSLSATYKGRRAGSIGIAGCFSFFPSKNLGAAGDAGMIVTNDEDLYRRLVMLRNHGASPKYYHRYVGGNFRLDPLQAAILLVKLKYLDSWSEGRRRNATHYDLLFQESDIVRPYRSPDCVSVFNQYVVRVENRDEAMRALKAAGISTEIYYPLPLHLQHCFADLVPRDLRLPNAEEASRHVLALPIYPELTPKMLDHVVSVLLTACALRPASV